MDSWMAPPKPPTYPHLEHDMIRLGNETIVKANIGFAMEWWRYKPVEGIVTTSVTSGVLLSTFRDYTPMTNCPIGIGNKEAGRKLNVWLVVRPISQ